MLTPLPTIAYATHFSIRLVALYSLFMLSSNTWAQCFQPTTNYPVGNVPYSVALSDLNADGRADMVVANRTSRTISVLPGLGNGSFGAATNYPTGNAPYSIALADVNGDGQLDVIALSANQTVSVLLGQVGGGFAAPVLYPAGTNGHFVAMGDVNGDGKADLVTPLLNNNAVSVVLGNGDGSFSAPVLYPAGTGPVSVALNDVNGDGYLDAITANVNASSVSILLGLGDGSFGSATNYPVGNAPYSVALSDVNGDGRADIVTANYASNTISVLPGQADGLFGPTAYYPVDAGPYSLALKDVNEDGLADIFVVNVDGNTVSVLLSSAPLGITQQPVSSLTVLAGANVQVPVVFSGMPTSYQWYKDGGSVSGQTSATLNLTGVTVAQAGSYELVALSACNSVTSTAFDLSVINPPIRYVKADGNGDGTSWATASGDLQAMINAEGVEQVWVAAGTYKPTSTTDRTISFSMKTGVSILGGFPDSGDPDLTQRSPASYTTTLSGDIGTVGDKTDNSLHVIDNLGSNTLQAALLDGFTITGGNADGSVNVGFSNAGGGILIGGANTATIQNCRIIDNSAINGGGVCFRLNASRLINCSLINNSSQDRGGGLYIFAGPANLLNCTLTGNHSAQGSFIYGGNPSLTNCILWNNDGENAIVGANVQASYCLIEPGETTYTGTNNLTADPQFVNAAGDYRLLASSPAINAGNTASYTAAGGPPTDLAGNVRIQNGTIDMGAYEFSLPTDLIPLLYVSPSLAYSTTTGSVVVDVFEINSAPTSGTITVHISKSALLSLSFDPSATSFLGRAVQNSGWSFDGTSSSDAYILTTTQVIGAGSKLSVGLTSTLTPGQTRGTVSVSATLVGSSGGEVTVTNNTDADKLEYFNK